MRSGGTILKTSGELLEILSTPGPEEAFKLTRQGQAVNLLAIVKLCLAAVNQKNSGATTANAERRPNCLLQTT
jgi:hypothetical protein